MQRGIPTGFQKPEKGHNVKPFLFKISIITVEINKLAAKSSCCMFRQSNSDYATSQLKAF